MKSIFTFLMLVLLLQPAALAAPPKGRYDHIQQRYDRQAPSYVKVPIWQGTSGGYDPNDPQKWGRNTLTCDVAVTHLGVCPTAPSWWAGVIGQKSTIKLNFTHQATRQVVTLNLVGEKVMYLNGNKYTMPMHTTGGTDDKTKWDAEPVFNVYIPKTELDKLTPSGTWESLLWLNLRGWSGTCGGNVNDPSVGCPGYPIINSWRADITIETGDFGNQQIYIQQFPHSTPVLNLNLKSSFEKTGKVLKGEAYLDICLYDGTISNLSRSLTLNFRSPSLPAKDRPDGAFSIWRLGGEVGNPRDRLDYIINIVNPVQGSRWDRVKNGVNINWSGINNPLILRHMVLPGNNEVISCVPAPIKLLTPEGGIPIESKNPGDYTGTLYVVYTPSTD